MGIKENKSNVIFYPDGLEIKISNNDSNGMHLNEMVNLIKMFNDSSSSEASHSKGIFTDCYIPLEKTCTALKISIVALSISIGTLVVLAIKRIKK